MCCDLKATHSSFSCESGSEWGSGADLGNLDPDTFSFPPFNFRIATRGGVSRLLLHSSGRGFNRVGQADWKVYMPCAVKVRGPLQTCSGPPAPADPKGTIMTRIGKERCEPGSGVGQRVIGGP